MIFLENILVNIGIMIILAVSLNFIVGITGILSLGHYAFFGIGGYSGLILSYYAHILGIVNYIPGFIVFFLIIIISGFIAGFFSFILSFPVLRLKGDYLAVATLGFNEVFKVLIENFEFVGGAKGYSLYIRLGNKEPLFSTNIVWVYIFVVFTLLFILKIMRSSYGLKFFAIRDDELASESIGIDISKYKTLSFVIGSTFAGFAGVLFVMYDRFYAIPKDFSFLEGILVLLMIVFGGLGSVLGSIIGAVSLTLLLQIIKIIPGVSSFQVLFYSVTLIFIMIFRPLGIGIKDFDLNKILNKVFKKEI